MKKDKRFFTGCLLGGAIGDALGAPIEFMSISEIRRRYGQRGIVDYVEHADKSGEFTPDDPFYRRSTSAGRTPGYAEKNRRALCIQSPTDHTCDGF